MLFTGPTGRGRRSTFPVAFTVTNTAVSVATSALLLHVLEEGEVEETLLPPLHVTISNDPLLGDGNKA
jgi:hypothetical protein